MIPPEYPFEPPAVYAVPAGLWHANVAADGRVLFDVLRSEWTPIMSLGGVLDALQAMLEEPYHLETPDQLACPDAGRAWHVDPRAVVQRQMDYWAHQQHHAALAQVQRAPSQCPEEGDGDRNDGIDDACDAAQQRKARKRRPKGGALVDSAACMKKR